MSEVFVNGQNCAANNRRLVTAKGPRLPIRPCDEQFRFPKDCSQVPANRTVRATLGWRLPRAPDTGCKILENNPCRPNRFDNRTLRVPQTTVTDNK